MFDPKLKNSLIPDPSPPRRKAYKEKKISKERTLSINILEPLEKMAPLDEDSKLEALPFFPTIVDK